MLDKLEGVLEDDSLDKLELDIVPELLDELDSDLELRSLDWLDIIDWLDELRHPDENARSPLPIYGFPALVGYI